MKKNLNYFKGGYQIIVPWDPAIDQQNTKVEDWIEWATTKQLDYSHIKMKVGETPTIIKMRNLPQATVHALEQMNLSTDQKRRMYFQYSLESIINNKQDVVEFPGLDENGNPAIEIEKGSTWQPTGVETLGDGVTKIVFVSLSELEFFSPNAIQFIGGIAEKKTNLIPGTKPDYRALLGSIAHWLKTKQ
jgi:hypothetical protein